MAGSSASANAQTFWAALRRLPPRFSQLLQFRFIDGRSDSDCAELYGITLAALAVHVLRAARLLQYALEHGGTEPLLPLAEPMPAESERALAARLLARLAAPTVDADSEVGPLAIMLKELSRCGSEIRALARAHLEAELRSPAYRRKELLRRAALIALLALAGWLYLRMGR